MTRWLLARWFAVGLVTPAAPADALGAGVCVYGGSDGICYENRPVRDFFGCSQQNLYPPRGLVVTYVIVTYCA